MNELRVNRSNYLLLRRSKSAISVIAGRKFQRLWRNFQKLKTKPSLMRGWGGGSIGLVLNDWKFNCIFLAKLSFSFSWSLFNVHFHSSRRLSFRCVMMKFFWRPYRFHLFPVVWVKPAAISPGRMKKGDFATMKKRISFVGFPRKSFPYWGRELLYLGGKTIRKSNNRD